MDIQKKQQFVARMGKGRLRLAKGGRVERKKFANGGAAASGALAGAGTGAAVGSIVPGIGTAIGAAGGAILGGLGGLFSDSGPSMPNIVDPVTGQQITDAQGNVIATQEQLQSFANSLNGVNGVQNQQAVYKMLQGVANGTGPNPAQTMLNQATGQNVANQAALMAGQRGSSSNVGLIAREAAQQGAATQQQAAQEAATLQAQQSLGAIGEMGQIAGQQVGEQQTALSAANASALQNQSNLLGAQGQYNTNLTGGQGNVNTTNANILGTLVPAAGNLIGGISKGAGASNAFNATTPPPVNKAHGGQVIPGPHKSSVANYLHHMSTGGKVPAMVSPGEIYLSPDKVEMVIREGADPLKIGEKIPGKAKVKGDSLKNDTIPRTLDAGGVVIPRHIASKKGMSREKAELFVHRAAARKRK